MRNSSAQPASTTNAVTKHRPMDGIVCTVIKDRPTGQALVDAITNLPASDQPSE